MTRAELLRRGFSSGKIRRWLQIGLLIRVYPGVYRVGHKAPSIEAAYLAAVKACGEGAVLSGRPAAWLLGLLRGGSPPPEVTAPVKRRLRGVMTHRGRPKSILVRGIPITPVARTLVDIAADLSDDDLATACHEAGVRYRTTPRHVEAALATRSNAPGARKLRRIMTGDTRVTLSRLEKRFLALLRENGLPLPRTNRPADGRYVDCRWPEHNLTVELDSYRFHNSRRSWKLDRRREREAYARHDDFRRYTWDDVFEDTSDMLQELRDLLPCQTQTGAPRPRHRRSSAARPRRL